MRVYFRRKGQHKVRLRETPGTLGFDTEYMRAFRGELQPAPQVPAPAAPGSVRWLCERYYESPAFKSLGDSTRKARRAILDTICDRASSFRYATMRPQDVAKLRDEKSATPEAANGRIKALRQLFAWAILPEYGYASVNPARMVSYLRSDNPEGFHAWTLEEVSQFEARHPVGTKARLALALLLYTGVRRSDVVKLGRQMERDGWLRFTETKGRARHPKIRELPILPELRAVLDATPSGHLTYLVTQFGKPFTFNGFGNWFRRRCDEAGLPHCSAHGLRKAGATIAANNGATEHQLMALFGWESPKQAARYTRMANRQKLAADAAHLLVRNQNANESVPLFPVVAPGGTTGGEKS